MKKRVSLKDIADKVGVSTALVSYVLNNQKVGRISKEVAERIRNTAHELNYRTNQIARSLKTKKTFTLGLIVADISNPFFSSLARIIEDEASKSNYTVLFGSSDENEQKSWKLINTFVDRQVDGLIIAPAENTEPHLRFLQEQQIPFVLVDRYFPELKSNYVALDNFQASYNSTEYFIKSGIQCIGMIGFKTQLFTLNERKRGYLTALHDHHIRFRTKWLKQIGMTDQKAAVEKAMQELLDPADPVKAILFASNVLGTYGLEYIYRQNIRVPEEVSLISFDKIEASDFFYAPLTYINQPLAEMGKSATEVLLNNIEKGVKTVQVCMEATLVIRKSTLKINL